MGHYNRTLHVVTIFLLIFSVNVNNLNCQSTQQSFTSSESSNATGSDKIETYVSGLELLLEDLGSLLQKNDTFIQKSFSDILSLFKDKFHAIFPGTYWCGPGNAASDYNDLGLFYKTDNCCRAHDNCPADILAGETLGPLINSGIFTRSACACDHEFYNCLKDIKSVIAKSIGNTYFNILRPQCFTEDYPIESCQKYSGILGRKKCIQYKLDTSKNKTLEWFDNRNF